MSFSQATDDRFVIRASDLAQGTTTFIVVDAVNVTVRAMAYVDATLVVGNPVMASDAIYILLAKRIGEPAQLTRIGYGPDAQPVPVETAALSANGPEWIAMVGSSVILIEGTLRGVRNRHDDRSANVGRHARCHRHNATAHQHHGMGFTPSHHFAVR